MDPFPPAYLSDWETNPTIASLTVSNGTGADANVTIHFTVTRGSGATVLQGRSDPQLVPAGTSAVFSSASTFDGSSSYDPQIEDIIVRTGRFPEDDYLACITLSDESGLVIADNLCAFFSSFTPDPPYLLFPSDADTIAAQDPIFEWTPVQVPVTVQPRYIVQVAEVLPGQSPYEALTSRIPHYEDFGQFMPAFQYPLGAQSFRQGQQYAWWVQALDASGYPLSSNEGRSEVWTFTYWSEDEGEAPGEEVGGGAQLLAIGSGATGADVVDLASSTYEAVRDQLASSSGASRIRLPLPEIDFLPLELWNVRVDSDDAQRALTIRATASLPHTSVDLLLVGAWDETGEAEFSLGLDPAVLRLADWIEGVEGTALADIEFDGGILTLASRADTLDAAQLPPAVTQFYGEPRIPLVSGVSLQHVADLAGTRFAGWLESLGLEASGAEISGDLGIDPSALFGEASAAPAPTLDLSVSLDLTDWEGAPEWLTLRGVALEVANDPALVVMLEAEVEASLMEETLEFVLRADLTNADGSAPLVLTGRSLTPWEQPLGIEWLTVDSARVTLSAPSGSGSGSEVVASGVLEGWVRAGAETIALAATVEGEGDGAVGVLSATVAELGVDDLVALVSAQTGANPFGALPANLPSLQDVRFELRSGEPPTFTVSATAQAFGQNTDFLYTTVLELPELGGGGGGSGGGTTAPSGSVFALRLSDWSLANMLPSLGGSPFGDLRFPAVSFVFPSFPSLPEPGPSDPNVPDGGGGGSWQIPWTSFGPLARDFLSASWPCLSCGGGGGGAPEGPDDPDAGGSGGGLFDGLSFRPGLNFSAPISLADLSAAFGGLFDSFGGGGGGTGGNLPPEDASDDVWFQGLPGITLPNLLAGNFDLTGLLDLSATLDLSGWDDVPEWMTLGDVSLAVASDPALAVMLEAEVQAELMDETLEFVLRADLTNADGSSPLVLTGRSLTPWEQPLGIEWLTVDSARVTLSAPSAGGSGSEVAASGVLEGWLSAGAETIALAATVEGEGDGAVGVLSATVAELGVDDLVALLSAQTGTNPFGGDLPANLPSLQDVRFELRSGEPPTFTVSATAQAFGQNTDFLYTTVLELPELGGGGGGSGGGTTAPSGSVFALRLSDWSLANMLPSLGGTPFGDLRFPEVSFVFPSFPSLPEPGPSDPNVPDGGGGGSWQIPWTSFGPLARDFLSASWPCLSCGGGGGGAPEGPDDPDAGGSGGGLFDGLSFRPGLNFSAPISLADLSAAFGGLFDSFGGGGGGTGGNLPLEDASDDVWFQGLPGITLPNLLAGNFDLTALLDLRATLPPLPDAPPFGWPDWLRPTERSLQITSDPSVSVQASVVLVADLDGEKVFDLTGQGTNAGGGGVAVEGMMRGRWDQPFGLEGLALDSVHIALGAGSVGPRVALGAGFQLGAVTAAADIDVRGPSDARTLDFVALARNLSTADLATFLNDAFDAGLAVPTNPITLDSLTVAFSTGEAASFDITGAFSAGMDASDALAALAELLPGGGPPSPPPFSLGTLAGAWFELHVVADSVWGGYGGGVELGGSGGPGLLGTASVRMGVSNAGGEDWVVLDMELAASELSVSDAVDALAGALPGGWSIPSTLESATDVTLDAARVRVSLDTRADSATVDLSGRGMIDGPNGALAASAALRLFDVADTTWADGSLSVALSDISVTEGLERAASLLPGDWTLPESLGALAPVQLDTAALTIGFDSRADSVSARVAGAGTMGGPGLGVTTDLSVVRLPTLAWAVGRLDLRVEDVALPDALTQIAAILPGDWTLPASMSGLSPIVLDTANLALVFDTRDAMFAAAMNGGSHMGEGASRLEGTTDLRLASSDDEQVVEGRVTLGVANLDLTELLAQVGALIAGDWSLPEDFTGFEALALDSALLDVGFSTRTDSLGASMRGRGRLADGTADVTASAALEFALVGEISGARGALELVAEDLTMTQALERVASMLPGDWALPEGLDAFDAVALDSAGFVIGFDTWADSVFAGVAGAGRFGELESQARLDFTHVPAGDRAAGLITISIGAVGAGEAIERITELLPGDWDLPDDFASFDALQLDDALLQAGFDTRGDSLWAGFEGAGRFEQRTAVGRLGFASVGGESYGSGRVTMELGDVSLDDAFAEVASLLPGDWAPPNVDFDIGSLRDVSLEVGFDTRADSVWAGVEAGATLAQRDGMATLGVISRGAEGGASESFVMGTFRVDVGDVTLADALGLAVSLMPSAPPAPRLDFDLGGISDAVLEAGFRIGAADSTWAGLSGRFDLGGLTGQAELGLTLGAESPSGYMRAAFDDSFTVPDVVSLMTGFLPGGGIDLPPLGPLDIRLDEPLLSLDFGERTGISLGGTSQLFGKNAGALFSLARIDGRPQFIFGVQVPDLGFTDILPDFSNPVTDALRLDLAALTLTRAEGRVEDEELSPAEREFFQPMAGGSDDFSIDFRPGLNLTGLIPLASGAMKEMVDMLSPGASSLMIQGTLPLPGFGTMRDMALVAALPPMAPPGKPAWFVSGEIGVQITGRPSVGVAGALTVDVDGDTLTFDIESNVAIVPAGVELSIAGGLSAQNPWVGPMGIDWLTLNEIRLALGLSPLAVRVGFLGDAVFGEKSIRVALGTKINIYTGVPTGALVLGEAPDGMSLGELATFHRQIAGPDAVALPTEALPDMAVRDLGIKVATYTDFDLGVEAGIGFSGAFFIQTGRNAPLSEFGRVEMSIDRDGIIAFGSLGAFSIGPVSFDDALFDLALTVPDQHLIISGGVTIAELFSTDIALAMSRDSLRFETDYMLFDAFRTHLLVRAGFDLTNPSFQVRAGLYPQFSDELMWEVIGDLIPVGQTSLQVASTALTGATNALGGAQDGLDNAVWAAGEAARLTMEAAYLTYQGSVTFYNRANSNYWYYANRCSWSRPLDCTRASYWASTRAFWNGQKTIHYGVYTGARTVYLNRAFLGNNPVVQTANQALANARAAFNDARLEVDRMRTALDQMEAWMDAMDACATCPRPPVPFNVESAEFEAALDGFFGQSGVQLDIAYRVFGARRTLNAGFSGSLTDLASSLFTATTDALF